MHPTSYSFVPQLFDETTTAVYCLDIRLLIVVKDGPVAYFTIRAVRGKAEGLIRERDRDRKGRGRHIGYVRGAWTAR